MLQEVGEKVVDCIVEASTAGILETEEADAFIRAAWMEMDEPSGRGYTLIEHAGTGTQLLVIDRKLIGHEMACHIVSYCHLARVEMHTASNKEWRLMLFVKPRDGMDMDQDQDQDGSITA